MPQSRIAPMAVAIASLLAGAPVNLAAQKTGTLNPGPARNRVAADSGKAQLARLIVDPSMANPVRASAWGVSLRADSDDSEVKIQANLSDLFNLAQTALSLSLIGPVNKDEDVTELADLDGLVGTARGELAWTHEIANASAKAKYYARVTGSAPKFEYRTLTGLAEEEARKPSHSIAGGVAFVEADNVFRLGGKYQNAFKASSERSICTPVTVGIPGAFECESIVLGEPGRNEKAVIEIEYRRTFGPYTSFALAVAHDVNKSITGFELPIWFIADPDDKFGGGIRLGYRSDDKRLTASVFVGQFKL